MVGPFPYDRFLGNLLPPRAYNQTMNTQQHSQDRAQDALVVARIQAGDAEAYAVLVRKYQHSLLSFMHRLVGDRDLAEDLGQEVFLSVYKSLRRFDIHRGVPFAAWLFIAARNRCVSELRRRGQAVGLEGAAEPVATDPDGEAHLLRRELGAAIEASLAQLPEPFRTTILQSLEGRSIQEIAALEQTPAGTIKSRLSRARGRLRELLSGRLPER